MATGASGSRTRVVECEGGAAYEDAAGIQRAKRVSRAECAGLIGGVLSIVSAGAGWVIERESPRRCTQSDGGSRQSKEGSMRFSGLFILGIIVVGSTTTWGDN